MELSLVSIKKIVFLTIVYDTKPLNIKLGGFFLYLSVSKLVIYFMCQKIKIYEFIAFEKHYINK